MVADPLWFPATLLGQPHSRPPAMRLNPDVFDAQ